MTENTPAPPPEPKVVESAGLLHDAVTVAEHLVDVGLPAYIGAKVGSHQAAPPPPPPDPPQQIILPPGVERD
jgi:hypothetical protein